MAIGQIINVTSGTQQLITAKSHSEVQSLGVLNPNDGVVYIKLNGPAQPLTPEFDWKLPSQSYGLFAGPWQSVGIYYQDQSGSGAAGVVDIYESNVEQAPIPAIVAIGRAIQVSGTTMDITQGSQPQSPPANTTRLWVDGNGNLQILNSSGTNKLVLDSATPFNGFDIYGINYNNLKVQSLSGGNTGLVAVDAPLVWPTGGRMNDYQHDGSGNPLVQLNGLTVTPGPSYFAGVQVNGNLTVSGTTNLQNTNVNILTTNSDIHLNNGSINANNPGNATFAGAMNSTQVYITGNPPYLFFPDGNHYMITSGDYLYMRWPNGILVQNSSGGWTPVECGALTTHSTITCNGDFNGSGHVQSAGEIVYGNVVIANASAVYWQNNGGLQIYPTSNTTLNMNCQFNCAGGITAASYMCNTTGYVFSANGTAANSIYIDGSTFMQFACSGPTFRFAQWGGQYFNLALNGGGMSWACSISATAIFQVAGSFSVNFGASSNGWYLYSYGTAGGNTGWNVGSTRKIKRDIEPIHNALALVKSDVHGYHYTLDPQLILEGRKLEDDEIITPLPPFQSYGFIGEEWQAVAPHVITQGSEVMGMDYGQVTAILFHAFKQYMEVTDGRISELESRLATSSN